MLSHLQHSLGVLMLLDVLTVGGGRHLSFLRYPFNSRHRTTFYLTLTHLLALDSDDVDASGAFEEFMKPILATFSKLQVRCQARNPKTQMLNQTHDPCVEYPWNTEVKLLGTLTACTLRCSLQTQDAALHPWGTLQPALPRHELCAMVHTECNIGLVRTETSIRPPIICWESRTSCWLGTSGGPSALNATSGTLKPELQDGMRSAAQKPSLAEKGTHKPNLAEKGTHKPNLAEKGTHTPNLA
jgi:hypothetical protein